MDRKTSESEIIYNFKDFCNVKTDASVWNTAEHDKVRKVQMRCTTCLASLACDVQGTCTVFVRRFHFNDV